MLVNSFMIPGCITNGVGREAWAYAFSCFRACNIIMCSSGVCLVPFFALAISRASLNSGLSREHVCCHVFPPTRVFPSGDKHGCRSQHISNSNSTSVKHLSLLPSPTASSQPTLHTQSIIYHPSFIINGNSQYRAYSTIILIFPIFSRLPSPLCPPLNSVKWSSPQNDSCHRR